MTQTKRQTTNQESNDYNDWKMVVIENLLSLLPHDNFNFSQH